MAGLATQEQLRSMELGEKPTRGGCTRAGTNLLKQ